MLDDCRVVVVGGCGDDISTLSTTEVLDPLGNSKPQGLDMDPAHLCCAVIPLIDHCILVIGFVILVNPIFRQQKRLIL